MYIKLIIFFILLLNFCYSDTNEIEIIQSDKTEILFENGNEKYIIFEGNVNIRYITNYIKGNRIIVDRTENIVYSDGNVDISTIDVSINTEKMHINIYDNKMILENNSGYYEPWYYYAKSMDISIEGLYILKRGYITSCSLTKNQHYKIGFSRAKYKTDDYLRIYNISFYIKNIPILYFPFWNVNLKESRWRKTFGYSSKRGYYLKNSYDIYVTETQKLTGIFDLHSRQGTGYGAKYSLKSDTSIVNLNYYYIKEKLLNSRTNRYRIIGNGSHKIAENFYAAASFKYYSDLGISDEYVSDYKYLESNYNVKANVLKNHDNYLWLLYSTSRFDRNPAKDKFTLTSATNPGFYYFRNYKKNYYDIYYNYLVDFKNETDRTRNIDNTSIIFKNNVIYGIPISNKSKFTSKLTHDLKLNSNENFYPGEKKHTNNLGVNLYHKYHFDINNHYILQYNYLKNYYGDKHKFLRMDYLTMKDNLSMLLGTGYSVNNNKNEGTSVLNKQLYNRIEYISKDYQIFNELNFDYQRGKINRNYINFHFTKYRDFIYNGGLFVYEDMKFDVGMTNSWVINLGSLFFNKNSDYEFFYRDRIDLDNFEFKEIYTGLKKRLHCFDMRIQFRKFINNEKEYYLIFNIADFEKLSARIIYSDDKNELKFRQGF